MIEPIPTSLTEKQVYLMDSIISSAAVPVIAALGLSVVIRTIIYAAQKRGDLRNLSDSARLHWLWSLVLGFGTGTLVCISALVEALTNKAMFTYTPSVPTFIVLAIAFAGITAWAARRLRLSRRNHPGPPESGDGATILAFDRPDHPRNGSATLSRRRGQTDRPVIQHWPV